MFAQRIFLRLFILAAIGSLAACSFGPPASCGEGVGGTADEARFAELFNSMELVSAATGEPGTEGENGAEFGAGDDLLIRVDSKAAVSLRACVQGRSGGGDPPFDTTASLGTGAGEIPIGEIQPGSYVIRMIVDGTLVKNFPFTVREG